MTILQEKEISKAVSNIVKRSERQEDISVLTGSFVDDIGILEQIDNNENQIMFGRRGTGKTHVFKVFQNQKKHELNSLSLYIDMRTLGSTNQFTDRDRPLSQRCYGLVKDLMAEVHNSLLDYATDKLEADKVNYAFEELNSLSEILNKVMLQNQEILSDKKRNTINTQKWDSALNLGFTKGNITIGENEENSEGIELGESIRSLPDYNFVIPSLSNSLKKILENAGIKKFYLLIDEWSAIDIELHPFFAEFIKKTFLPLPKFVVKIASLEYRSVFSKKFDSRQIIGFELGGDIAADINLDDYYVYDKNPNLVTETFAKLLLNHLATQFEDNRLEEKFNIKNSEYFIRKFFTSPKTFTELVRAAEGVPRDLINIFNISFFIAKNSGTEKIDIKIIEQAARQWYQSDKAASLSEVQVAVLNRIVDDVIGHRNARAFLLEQKHAKNEVIRSLFDSRVIHQLQKGYSDKDTRGARFDIYILDYGTYVDLKRTSNQLEMDFAIEEDFEEDRVVPFNDKRSIRRVILRIETIEYINTWIN